jgi:uncharacterized tellurite resistance protein B-like protein
MSYFEESTKLGSLPSWIDPFDFGKHTPVIIKTTIPAVVKDVTNTAGDQTIDLTQAKALIAKYGVTLATQVIKGLKTIAQADAELAAIIASRKAGMEKAQAAAQAGDQTIDLTQAKALIAKYGAARAYQVIKGTKTIAQADAEIAALKPVVQSSGIVNTVVNIVKSNWLLFAIGGVLLFFGPSLFKSRR